MSDDERTLLAFEDEHPRNDRAKEAAVREAFGISWVRYRQLLLQLVRRRDVLEEFPVVAHRVIRTTAVGIRARATRSFAA